MSVSGTVALMTGIEDFLGSMVSARLRPEGLPITFQDSAPTELTAVVSVPQTDSGGREEYSKALERTHPKELGKILP